MENNSFPLSRPFSIFLCLFLSLVILAVPLLLIALPSSDRSDDENRMLATLPQLSADTLFSGQYTDGLSAYLRDHLPLRTSLLKTKAATELAALKRENNAVILADNFYLVKRFEYTPTQLNTFSQNVATIERISASLDRHGKPVVFLCAPRAIDVLQDFCPAYAQEPYSVWLQTDLPKSEAFARLLREKANAGERVWYRTDHHWTTLGAYYAYTFLGETLGYIPFPREAFCGETVCEDFLGTSYSAGLFPLYRPDRILSMRYTDDQHFTCTDVTTGATHIGLYRAEALNTKDKYAYFLGQNVAHMRIQKNPERPRPTLLVIKDSYAQSLVPFLARHFDIEMIDLRYYRTDATDTVRQILLSDHYAGALILCNADTLTGDVGFTRLNAEKLQ